MCVQVFIISVSLVVLNLGWQATFDFGLWCLFSFLSNWLLTLLVILCLL